MSAMRHARVSKRPDLGQAFSAYVKLVGRIGQVVAVVADDGAELTLTTVIKRRDLAVCARLFVAERQFRERFPGLEPDFRILYAQNRPLQEVIAKPSSYGWSWVRNAVKSATSGSVLS